RGAVDPGFVAKAAQPAEPAHGGGDERVDFVGPRHVTPHRQSDVVPAELLGRRLGGAEIQIANYHACALCDELLPDGVPETLRTAGDYRGLIGQQRHLITPFRWSRPHRGPINRTSSFIYDRPSPHSHTPTTRAT